MTSESHQNPRNPFQAMFEQAREAKKKAEIAHSHAAEFSRALRDETAAAMRAGACQTCVTNEALLKDHEDTPAEKLAAGLSGISDEFAGVLLSKLIEREAERLAKVQSA